MTRYPAADPKTLDTARVELDTPADRVATVTIDRPEKRNSLTEAVKGDLRAALGWVLESEVRAVVLTGAGESTLAVLGRFTPKFSLGSEPRALRTARLTGHCVTGDSVAGFRRDGGVVPPHSPFANPRLSLAGLAPSLATPRRRTP
ncbi:enoyl-CoA hydratase/isomerase family protein [Halomarina litorea]|uniref:enoyl-CoA hydratase/isomerase family protein n=1 Tax=Halomarina litorea TaxID=2961595 RepID=UPI0020C54E63|nr:hypothetical protein [Halomarina sp. BCD28]